MSEFPCRFDRPKPWQGRQDGQCRRCDRPVDYVIETMTDDRMRLKEIRPGVFAEATSELLITFSCAEHHEAIADEYCERYGSTVSNPVTPVTWSYWLASFWWRAANRWRGLFAERLAANS